MTMPDVQQLLEAFIAEDRGPAPADPLPYLAQVDGIDRRELELLIDAYLARAPRRPVASVEDLPTAAREVVEQIERSLLGAGGQWPVLLPRLRDAARLPRRELVEALARRLGVQDQTERVAGYYHAMEQGLLPSEGVSDRVLEALGALLGRGVEQLRAAGRAIGPPGERPAGRGDVAFARTAMPDEELVAGTRPDARGDVDEERGIVDELFTGGPGGGSAR